MVRCPPLPYLPRQGGGDLKCEPPQGGGGVCGKGFPFPRRKGVGDGEENRLLWVEIATAYVVSLAMTRNILELSCIACVGDSDGALSPSPLPPPRWGEEI